MEEIKELHLIDGGKSYEHFTIEEGKGFTKCRTELEFVTLQDGRKLLIGLCPHGRLVISKHYKPLKTSLNVQ